MLSLQFESYNWPVLFKTCLYGFKEAPCFVTLKTVTPLYVDWYLLVFVVWEKDFHGLKVWHYFFFRELSEDLPGIFVNQFPNENLVTIKDLLAIVARRAEKKTGEDNSGRGPKWLPITYNLQSELPKFVSLFQQRESQWVLLISFICKWLKWYVCACAIKLQQ